MSFSLVYEAQVTFNYLFFIIWTTFFTGLCLDLFQFFGIAKTWALLLSTRVSCFRHTKTHPPIFFSKNEFEGEFVLPTFFCFSQLRIFPLFCVLFPRLYLTFCFEVLYYNVALNPENAENRLSFLNKQKYFQCEFHTKLNIFKIPYLKVFWIFSVTYLNN